MQTSILEIKKANAKKRLKASKADSLGVYEERQKDIKKLLKRIEIGLQFHDRNASISGGHHWGHVGDLGHIISVLTEVNGRLPQK